MTDFRPGDVVRLKHIVDGPHDLVVEIPSPHDQRPQFKDHLHLRREGWVLANEYEIADPVENDLRRAILDVLIRKDYEWPEDEKEAYRKFGWQPGVTCANDIRVQKIIDAFEKHQRENQ